jgi:fucose permease
MLLPFAQGGGRPSPSVAGGAFPAITPRRAAFLLLGAFGVGFEVALIGLGPTALIARELSEKAAAELVSALFVFFLAARLALVWAAGRFAPLLLLAIAHGLGALCAALASALPPGAFYALAGASAGLMFPCFYIAASRFFGTSGRAAAAIMVPGYLGAILLPLGASQAMAAWGDAALFPLLACIAAAGCAATLFFARASADMR